MGTAFLRLIMLPRLMGELGSKITIIAKLRVVCFIWFYVFSFLVKKIIKT